MKTASSSISLGIYFVQCQPMTAWVYEKGNKDAVRKFHELLWQTLEPRLEEKKKFFSILLWEMYKKCPCVWNPFFKKSVPINQNSIHLYFECYSVNFPFNDKQYLFSCKILNPSKILDEILLSVLHSLRVAFSEFHIYKTLFILRSVCQSVPYPQSCKYALSC